MATSGWRSLSRQAADSALAAAFPRADPDHLHEAIGQYDHVTRLPNRVPFLDHLSAALDRMRADTRPRTLVLVTLSDAHHFNAVLRALGHAFSEDFIRAGTDRVAACLDGDTRIFHVSVLSLAFVVNRDAARAPQDVAQAIDRAFADPLVVQDIPIRSNVGVGLVNLAADVTSPAEALRAALTAAQDSRNRSDAFAYYDPHTDAAHQRAFRILTDLPKALEASDQLRLHYQPRLDLTSDSCGCAEALIRWHHPELGWVSPGEFMPLVETTALIQPLTAFVLETAIRQARAWHDAGHAMKVSVNVSPRNLAEPDFLERVQTLLDRHGVDPAMLEFEFTEGAVSPDNATTLANLRRVRELGIEVAIDDFGSGYSNMAYLTKIPADIVKIDKAFVLSLDSSEQDRFLTHKIADLARGLGFHVVGEGVESARAYAFLRDIGCREAQGFHLSKPLPPAELEAWLNG
ncbi:EAL domain, c-di-GMP-specific phosphodiesterase class I (or its enzymatically inactive variant) [Limimonas halophila]|uniref:EAL domain, c-di-GMP-specific phosphodiesterase class I (Or its enzymatically inactive variant) n=1 Tax=Limimonas halophila TaxID=1082479 RepID=A0A1G7V2Z6_9PROT|nr:bifunctional diguanylate cyclase/phosphodiesterase [Limimonas halophila]SDG54097.1 EAL domain, c-di-GMP-specific phosphodiesterase class I (or its enzymatically inactive variant) [Limimonas halophila]